MSEKVVSKDFEFGFEHVLAIRTHDAWSDSKIVSVLEDAITITGLKPVKKVTHLFSPQGMTTVWILEESHLAVSTWPEKETVIIHVFACDKNFDFVKFKDFVFGSFVSCAELYAKRTFEL